MFTCVRAWYCFVAIAHWDQYMFIDVRKYDVRRELSENTPIYWNYGLGRTLALSSHSGLVGYCGPTSLFWS